MTNETITILKAKHKDAIAAKVFEYGDNGEITWSSYRLGMYFSERQESVSDINELHASLTDLELSRKDIVIRGRLKDGIDPRHVYRRAKGDDACFDPCLRRWVCVDIDELPIPDGWEDFNTHAEDIVGYGRSLLPSCFNDATCHWQFSSSMGIKEGIRLHLWFYLSRALTDDEAKAVLLDSKAKVDLSLFRPVQPHYTAAPVFLDGIPDPVTRRSALSAGKVDVVNVPADIDLGRHVAASIARATGHSIDHEIIRNADGMVVDGRENFLFHCSVKASAELMGAPKRNGVLPNVDEIASKTWDLFEASADLTDSKWSFSDAENKAVYRHRDLRGGWNPTPKHDTHLLYPEVPPYHSLEPVPLEEGERVLRDTLGLFFERVEDGKSPRLCVRITPGVGKTNETFRQLVEMLNRNPFLRVANYMQRHDLLVDFSGQVDSQLAHPDLIQTVHFRGRDYTEGDGKKPMCSRTDLVAKVVGLRQSVRHTLCKTLDDRRCLDYSSCLYWKQMFFPGISWSSPTEVVLRYV